MLRNSLFLNLAFIMLFNIGSMRSMDQDKFINAIILGDQATVKALCDKQEISVFADYALEIPEEERIHVIEINKFDDDGITPLIYALINKHFAIAKMLIDKDANPNLEDADGETPFLYMVKTGNIEALNFLKEHNAIDVNKIDLTTGNNVLKIACAKGNSEVVEFLVKNGANISFSDISVAVVINNERIVDILIRDITKIEPFLLGFQNLLKTAEKGSHKIHTMISYVYGVLLLNTDIKQAKAHFENVLLNPGLTFYHSQACLQLAEMYIYGKGLMRNLHKAMEYLVRFDFENTNRYLEFFYPNFYSPIIEKYTKLLQEVYGAKDEPVGKKESPKKEKAESKEKKEKKSETEGKVESEVNKNKRRHGADEEATRNVRQRSEGESKEEKTESKEEKKESNRELTIIPQGLGKYLCECGHIFYGPESSVKEHRDSHDPRIGGAFKCSICVIPTFHRSADGLARHKRSAHISSAKKSIARTLF